MLALVLLVEAATVASGSPPAPTLGVHLYSLLLAHPYLTTLACLVALTFLVPFLIDLPHRLPNEPPLVPSYLPYLGSALSFSRNPTAFLTSCRARYGDVFTLHLAGRRMTFLCDPLSYPALFRHRGLVFAQVAGRIAQSVFDQGKASVEDEAVSKAVHSHYVQYLSGEGLEQLTSATDVQLRAWMRQDRERRGGAVEGWHSVPLYRYMTDLAFDAGVKTMFGEGVDTQTLKPLFYAFDAAFPLFVGGAPTFLLSKAKAARLRLNSFLGSLGPHPREAAIIGARRDLFAASPAYRPYDVGATQTGMLWASVANTVPAAFWTVAYLLCDEGAMGRVREEVDRVVPYHPLWEEGEGVRWSRELCAQLKLTDSAVSEALRLSTGSMVLREATAATTLTLASGQTVSLRAGDGISVYPALTHLDARVFAEPQRYRVDRFVDAPTPTLQDQKVPMAFMPFGGGVSLCPGRHWARNEIVMLVALLLQHVEWKVEGTAQVPPMDYSRVGIGVYQPRGELQVSLRYK